MAPRGDGLLVGPTMGDAPAIGIDLGTTNCCVGVWRHGRVEIIPNDQGHRTTPSYVAFTGSGILIGNSAKNQAVNNAANTIYQAKRLIGRRFDDAVVRRGIATLPFRVVRGPDHRPRIVVNSNGETKQYEPQFISALILGKMKEIAEANLDAEVRDAVITVPANFNQAQKLATREAAQSAGLNVLRLITEPSAAALTYALGRNGAHYFPALPAGSFSSPSSPLAGVSSPPASARSSVGTPAAVPGGSDSSHVFTVMVVDWGGGTFDVSVMTLKRKELKVIAVEGDTHLGGEDLDENMADYFAREFARQHGKDLRGDDRAMRRLRAHCQDLKHVLSFALSASTEVDCLYAGIDYSMSMTRACFEKLNLDLFTRCMRLIEKVVVEAHLDKRDISKVVLAGGSTRIPKLQRMLTEFFDGKEPLRTIHPDEAIAHGAAIRAAMMTGAIGLEMVDSAVVEAIPVSLGYKTACHRFHKMIERNMTYPTEVVVRTQTTYPGDKSVTLPVYEGERENAIENRCLGKVILEGLNPGPPGSGLESVPLKIVFRIDGDGILSTSIVDKTTGRRVSKTFGRGWGRFSREEGDRMAMEAARCRAQDEEHVARARARHDMKSCLRALKARVAMAEPSKEKEEAERELWKEEALLHGSESLSSITDYVNRQYRLRIACASVINSLSDSCTEGGRSNEDSPVLR